MTGRQTILTRSELHSWIEDRRSRLAGALRRTSCPTLRLLEGERITPHDLLALASREILDPDWRSGFIHRCTVVVRPEGAHGGRLGL